MRGHGALLGACDSTLHVEKLTDDVRSATLIKANDNEEGEQVTFSLESITIGPETTAPVVVAADMPEVVGAEAKLTKNQQMMYSILHDAGYTGLTQEQWNDKAREAGLGLARRADLHDLRTQLKAKQLVRELTDRWMVK